MTCNAILVGNANYENQGNLDCCKDDIIAINELLMATKNFDKIITIENKNSAELKEILRTYLIEFDKSEELFFYFSGHGYQNADDFFYCATDFRTDRPNETGVSNSELQNLLKSASPQTVIKLIDACNSGIQAVKSGFNWSYNIKDVFRNFIQISSCLDFQTCLTGEPLSLFTQKFILAALRKTEGKVYYSDIIDTLRDEFIENNSQTPFFVTQGTGREIFVDDANLLNSIRNQPQIGLEMEAPVVTIDVPNTKPLSLLDRIQSVNSNVTNPIQMSDFIAKFFDSINLEFSKLEFSDFFDIEIAEYPDFHDETPQNFIVEILSKQKRLDNFVTATYSREYKNSLLNRMAGSSWALFSGPEFEFTEEWNLKLNCFLNRAQVRLKFQPKFLILQKIVFIITCAPSLDKCYIFEIGSQFLPTDFDKHEWHGVEVSRRWWQQNWNKSSDGIVRQIVEKVRDVVKLQLEATESRFKEKL